MARRHFFSTLFSVSKKGLKNEPPGSVLGFRNRPKIDKKSTKYHYRNQSPFLHKFGSAVGFKMEAPNPTFPSETICFCGRQRKPAFVTRRRFCIAFGTPSAPFWYHLGRQNREKEPPKRYRKHRCFFVMFFYRILVNFGSKKDEAFRGKGFLLSH